MAPVVYTSSMAVYTADDADPVTGRLTVDAYPHPPNHYGVYKQANEGNARIYWLDSGLSSVGVRPMTVYGVGRDQGMTSGPTKAIVAAVLGQPYRVSFSGPTMYQYAADVARTLIAASRSSVEGAHVFNLPGEVADGRALAAAIEAVVPGAAERIEFEPGDLPFPSEIDHDGIEAIDPAPRSRRSPRASPRRSRSSVRSPMTVDSTRPTTGWSRWPPIDTVAGRPPARRSTQRPRRPRPPPPDAGDGAAPPGPKRPSERRAVPPGLQRKSCPQPTTTRASSARSRA